MVPRNNRNTQQALWPQSTGKRRQMHRSPQINIRYTGAASSVSPRDGPPDSLIWLSSAGCPPYICACGIGWRSWDSPDRRDSRDHRVWLCADMGKSKIAQEERKSTLKKQEIKREGKEKYSCNNSM